MIPIENEQEIILYDSVLTVVLKYLSEVVENSLSSNSNFDYVFYGWYNGIIDQISRKLKSHDCLRVLLDLQSYAYERVKMINEFKQLDRDN